MFLNALIIKDFTVFSRVQLQFGALSLMHGETGSGKPNLFQLTYSLVA